MCETHTGADKLSYAARLAVPETRVRGIALHLGSPPIRELNPSPCIWQLLRSSNVSKPSLSDAG